MTATVRTMKAKVLNDAPERTIALIFDSGDDVMATLQAFATEHNLMASRFTAIGAFQRATLGYFDWRRKEYERIPVNEQVEVVSIVGDIALDDDNEPKVHAHAVLGRRDGSTLGGHLLEATVRPTLEVLLTESPDHLRRVCDPRSGIALIRVDA
ncbi:MAG TPA: PPC domain-containing DNA-binding protein [Burkholderiaceae bacterium]